MTTISFVALCTLVVMVLACGALVLAVVCVRKAGPTDIFRGGIEGDGSPESSSSDLNHFGPTFGDSGKQCGSSPQPSSQVKAVRPCAERQHSVDPLDYTPKSSFTDDIRRAMERKHFGTKIKDDCGAMDFTEDRKEWTTL